MASLNVQFLGVSGCATYACLRRTVPKLAQVEAACLALPMGMGLAAFLSFCSCALAGRVDTFFALTVPSLVMGIAWAVCVWWPRKDETQVKCGSCVRELWNEWWPMLGFCGVISLWLVWLCHHHYLSTDQYGSQFTGGTTYGDLAIHLQIITSIVNGPNDALPFWQWKSPIYSDSALLYPFLPDFLSAILMQGGWSLSMSLWVPSAMLCVATVLLLFLLGKRFTGSHRGGMITVCLVLCAGGLGFLWFVEDVTKGGFWATLRNLQVDYVHFIRQGTPRNPFWFQFVGNVMLPQRSSQMGFPLTLSALLLVDTGLKSRLPWRRFAMAWAGLVAGTLPFSLTHGFIALGVMGAVWVLLYPRLLLDWASLALPAATLGLPQILYFLASSGTVKSIKFAPMWQEEPLSDPLSYFNFLGPQSLIFWPVTLGLFPIVGLLAFLFLCTNKHKFQWAAGFLAVWVVASFVQFQPWALDNIKILYVAHFGISCAIAALLERAFRSKRWWIRIPMSLIALAVFLLLILSGLLGNIREGQTHYQYFDQNDRDMAHWARQHTDKDDLFFAAPFHAHPIPCLAGRGLMMGYVGWLSSHGYNYGEREQDWKKIAAGESNAPELLEKYHISYAVVGWEEQYTHPPVNGNYFVDTFPSVFKNAKHQVFDVRDAKRVAMQKKRTEEARRREERMTEEKERMTEQIEEEEAEKKRIEEEEAEKKRIEEEEAEKKRIEEEEAEKKRIEEEEAEKKRIEEEEAEKKRIEEEEAEKKRIEEEEAEKKRIEEEEAEKKRIEEEEAEKKRIEEEEAEKKRIEEEEAEKKRIEEEEAEKKRIEEEEAEKKRIEEEEAEKKRIEEEEAEKKRMEQDKKGIEEEKKRMEEEEEEAGRMEDDDEKEES